MHLHGLDLGAETSEKLDRAARIVSARLDIAPIITYPLYIRVNPLDIDRIRRFTPYEAEFRFIRMHRLIEDIFDKVIRVLDDLLDAPVPREALTEALRHVLSDPALHADLSARGRARALRFSWSEAARQTAQIYCLAGEDL